MKLNHKKKMDKYIPELDSKVTHTTCTILVMISSDETVGLADYEIQLVKTNMIIKMRS